MPWEITIVNYAGNPPASYQAAGRPDPAPLGSRDEVIQAIRMAVPELEWHELAPRVASMPAGLLAILSPETREAMSRTKTEAAYDSDGLHLRLYGFEQEPVRYLHAEVRGRGNPVPLLARLCGGQSWSVVSDADGSFVDLTAAAAPQWDGFQAYRDRAVSGMHDPGSKPS